MHIKKKYLIALFLISSGCSLREIPTVDGRYFGTKHYKVQVPQSNWKWYQGNQEYRAPSIRYIEDIIWKNSSLKYAAIHIVRFKQYDAFLQNRPPLKGYDPLTFEGAVMYAMDQYMNWRQSPPSELELLSSKKLTISEHEAIELNYGFTNSIEGKPSKVHAKFICINIDDMWVTNRFYGSQLNLLVLWYSGFPEDFDASSADFDTLVQSVVIKPR